jgi:2-dehydropantoate 2-reductase
MKVCVFGAGAVGGYLATRLLMAGPHEVAVVARGAHLHAIAHHGLTLIDGDQTVVVHPAHATDRPHTLPPQDLVFVTLKAHALPAAAPDIAAMLGPGGCAVFVNNGIPWWWHHHGTHMPGESLPLLDPTGALWSTVTPQRSLGCVVYSANELLQPGVVRHTTNNQWWLGEPSGEMSTRLTATTALMREAGLNAEAVPDIRTQVWAKLLRNTPMNALCALSRLDVGALAREPGLLGLFEGLVDEVTAVALAHGVDLSVRVAQAKAAPRLGGAVESRRAAAVRPSMLQDIESGRAMEVEPILGQVLAFAQASQTPTPVLALLVPLMRGLNHSCSRVGTPPP